jgi:regulatory protein
MRPRREEADAERSLPTSGTVTAIKGQQRNPERVNIYLDGEFAFAITREEAVMQGLRIGRELTVDEVGEFRARDTVSKAIESALRLLTVRPRTEKELRDRLRQKAYEPSAIDAAIERIHGWGYLDDAAFARLWVANRTEHRPRGKRMLVQELRQKGVDRETISETIDDAEIDEVASAIAVAENSARKMSSLDPIVARRRLMGQLARRGFDYGTIKTALDQVLGEHDEDVEDDAE